MENKTLIDKAIGYIQANPKEKPTLRNIATHAGFSLNYFDALFRCHTGYTPVEYARVYKLTRTALELRRTQKTVLEIALEFGYGSHESFTRAFKAFYGMPPVEYRERYASQAVTWHDLSGKIAVNHFRNYFPELRPVDPSIALDHCFTHDPVVHFEDMVNMTVAETEVFTLGDPQAPAHLLIVSDYNKPEPSVDLICETEEDTLSYARLLAKLPHLRFSIRKRIDSVWELFEKEMEFQGFACRKGYDMVYPHSEIAVPTYNDLFARELREQDLPNLEAFCQQGGCDQCHVNAVRIHFLGKGNLGMHPCGVFKDGELIALVLPVLDHVRDLFRYDIGGIFTTELKDQRAIELLWKFVIDLSLKDNATLGNANAKEDDSPLSVDYSQQMGLVPVAISVHYR